MPLSGRPAFRRSYSLAATAAEKALRGTCGRKDILGTWWSLSSSRKVRQSFHAETHWRNFCRSYTTGFRSSVGVPETSFDLTAVEEVQRVAGAAREPCLLTAPQFHARLDSVQQ